MPDIDSRAAVGQGAELADDVKIGPFAVVGDKVKIGRGSRISAHAVIEDNTEIGEDNFIAPFATLGGDPQHVTYKGENTRLVIGDRNRIREYVTIHRGTRGGRGETRVGSDNFIMVGCHVAHDCVLGDRIIMANLATLAGHVVVEDDAVFGGFVGVHQYCRVGRAVMVAAGTKTAKDATPFALVGGDPPRFVGLNRVGLKRIGMDEATSKALRKAYRILFEKTLEDGIERAEAEYGEVAEVMHLINFIKGSERGIIRD